jgi:hypothetical protein
MKIERTEVRIQDCELGEVFEYEDKIYLKVHAVHAGETSSPLNAVRLDTGLLTEVRHDSRVVIYEHAFLKLNG